MAVDSQFVFKEARKPWHTHYARLPMLPAPREIARGEEAIFDAPIEPEVFSYRGRPSALQVQMEWEHRQHMLRAQIRAYEQGLPYVTDVAPWEMTVNSSAATTSVQTLSHNNPSVMGVYSIPAPPEPREPTPAEIAHKRWLDDKSDAMKSLDEEFPGVAPAELSSVDWDLTQQRDTAIVRLVRWLLGWCR